MTERKNVLQIVQSTTAYFEKHGIESSRLNAQLLIAHLLRVKKMELYTNFERELYEDELVPLRDAMRKRVAGVPLQHLLGSVEFFGRVFRCDSRALIPRPETERLVEIFLPLLKENGRRIVDVGTGSGVIAITIAAEMPEAEVWAVDLSPEALALAEENAAALAAAPPSPIAATPSSPVAATPSSQKVEAAPSPPLSNLHFLPSHLLAQTTGTFDWIVANLPYIPSGDLSNLSKEVQADPQLALDGGPDGLDLIRQLIETAPPRLNAGGGMALEIGHDQAERGVKYLEAANFRDIRVEKDYENIPRFLIALHG